MPVDIASSATPQPGDVSAVRVIEPSSGWLPLRVREWWDYRDLLYFLTWRDIKVRYKQTLIGVAWTLLQPLVTVVLFTVIFNHLAKLPADGAPYPIFFYAGYLPWQVFSVALTRGSGSLVMNKELVTKIYFPRIFIPASAVLGGFLDFLVASSVLVGLLFYYDIAFSARLFALPAFAVLAALAALAVAIWLSALNVRYRDVQYTTPFLTQLWFFATPIAYTTTIFPGAWKWLVGANPIAGVVEGFRWSLFGTEFQPLILISVAVVFGLLATGLVYFRRTERTFADVV